MIPKFIAEASVGDSLLGGVLGAVVVVVGLFLAVAWIVFPFLVQSCFKELIAVTRETNELLRHMMEREKKMAEGELKEKLAAFDKKMPPPVPRRGGEKPEAGTGTYKLD